MWPLFFVIDSHQTRQNKSKDVSKIKIKKEEKSQYTIHMEVQQSLVQTRKATTKSRWIYPLELKPKIHLLACKL